MNRLPFQPAALEHHYALDRACQLVQALQPQTVLIGTLDLNLVLLAVRRLAWLGNGLAVAQPELAAAVDARLGVQLTVTSGVPDVALILHARQHYLVPPQARHLVLVGQNAWSYKSLRTPGQISDHAAAQLGWLRQRYTLTTHLGLFGPQFVARWSQALAWGPRCPALHFQAEQAAVERLFTSRWWWLSYITILAGTWRG